MRTSIYNNWRNELGQCAPVNRFQHTISYSYGVSSEQYTGIHFASTFRQGITHGHPKHILPHSNISNCMPFIPFPIEYLFIRAHMNYSAVCAASIHGASKGKRFALIVNAILDLHKLSIPPHVRCGHFFFLFATFITSGVVETIEAYARK